MAVWAAGAEMPRVLRRARGEPDEPDGAGHDHGSHQHGPAADSDRRWLWGALSLILVYMAAEIVIGLAADSLALISDAAHMLTDAASIGLVLITMRLAARPPGMPTVLVNHWPLTRLPTLVLRYPEFAQWCGTTQTADWHQRFRAAAVVYGHLHIPRTMFEDGVRFEEVSLGYPYEQDRHPERPRQLIQILPPGPARTLGPPPADGSVHPSPGR